MEKFNQKKYIQNYQNEHYSIFKVKLKKEEKKELDELLAAVNSNQAQFLRNAIQNLKTSLKK
nr:MAG TPA: NikA, BACTERIAL CONJUGATION, RELAXASE, DNA [Caudoviricetes sp.]